MITKQQFLLRQPSFPEEKETDRFYLDLANRLADKWRQSGIMSSLSDALIDRVCLCLIGYYQDIMVDAGLWRAFIHANRYLYGRTLPFYETGEDYIDCELNEADVRFMVWYALAMQDESRRDLYPLDEELLKIANLLYTELDAVYDEAPMPVDFGPDRELDLHNPEDFEEVSRLGHWLFLHSYLLTPAFALQLSQMVSGLDPNNPESSQLLQQQLDQAMAEEPIGPLALYLHEWLYLIVKDTLPPRNRAADKKAETEKPDHPYYKAFTKATKGETIKFFGSYAELNKFFIKVLGWTSGEDHMPQFRNERDFVLMVEQKKGMLLAKNICRCIKSPLNPYYDEDYARSHAFELLSVRGLCPHDLMVRLFKEKWLPDVRFPGTDDTTLALHNADFIARCYLQLYYRGD